MDRKRLITDYFDNADDFLDVDKERILVKSEEYPVAQEFVKNSRSKRIIFKTIAQNRYEIYSKLKDVYNPFLETVLETGTTKDKYWAITKFIPRPTISDFDFRLEDLIGENDAFSLQFLIEYFPNVRGSAFCYTHKEKKYKQLIPESYALSFVYQICEGLKPLHKQGINHHDIAPQNILFTDSPCWLQSIIPVTCYEMYPLLIDFGEAKKIDPDNPVEKEKTGTQLFSAPEIYDNKPKDKIDIYSLGCILMYMCCGMSPNDHDFVNNKIKTSSGFNKIVRKCMDSYEFRYPNVNALQKDIIKQLSRRFA